MPGELPLEQRTVAELLSARAEAAPDQPFLLWREESISFAELYMRTNALAAGFAGRGVGAGSHVAIFMTNSPEFVLICLALGRLGAVGVPINTAARGPLLAYLLEDSESELAIVDADLASIVRGAAPQIPLVLHGESGAQAAAVGNASSLAELVAGGEGERETFSPQPVFFADPWLVMYTSGTTGPSKGVVCPHAHPIGVAQDVARLFELEPADRLYACLPLFHANALWYSALAALAAGASVAVVPKFSASGFWKDVDRYGATEFNAIMAVVSILEKLAPTPEEKRNCARLAFVVPLPARADELEDRWGLKFACNYSMTELTPASVLRPGQGRNRPGASGAPVEHMQMRIVDENDLPVPGGTPGEIAVRPRDPWSIFSHYHRKPEATVEAFRNLWFHTGDRGYLDDDGYFYFVDRATDSLRRRGENISAQEIELVLESDSRIIEAAVTGVPSELGEDEVAVYVVPARKDLTEHEVIEIAAEKFIWDLHGFPWCGSLIHEKGRSISIPPQQR